MARNKKIIITIIIAVIVVFAWAPWLDNQVLHDKVFEERAGVDGTIDQGGNLICDYHVNWFPFGRYIASCEGGYFATFWGKILFPESPYIAEENESEKCSWEITREGLEKLGLHCSQIVGYYYGPAIVGMPSDKYECNPVGGCHYDPEIVPFETREECETVCMAEVFYEANSEVIKDYLERNIGITAFDGKVFCSYDVFGERREKETINEYLWVLCQEHYLENRSLEEGSGVSLPVALIIERVGGSWQIINHRIPRDGSYYGPDIEEIFPEEYHIKIFPQAPDYSEYNQRAERLSNDNEEEADAYFKIK